MKTDHIEYPKLKAIRGTDIAYILAPVAVNVKNGFDKYMDYLASKTDGVKTDTNSHNRVLREYCYKLYKRHGKSLEDLEQDIKDNKAELVGDMFFSAINQDFELDDNGNLLLRSYGSDLDNVFIKGGDVLLDSNGKVLKSTKGHMFIRKADPFGNYPCDVFVSSSKPMSDVVDIVRIDYNFLTPDGKQVSRKSFTRTDTPTIHEIDRTYSDHSDDKVYVDSAKMVYPKAYIFDPGKKEPDFPTFYPSATALLIENRSRIEDGLAPIVDDERPYLIEHYRRAIQMPTVQSKLTQKSQRGSISFSSYVNAMRTLADEQMLVTIFGEHETKEDIRVLQALQSGELENSELAD